MCTLRGSWERPLSSGDHLAALGHRNIKFYGKSLHSFVKLHCWAFAMSEAVIEVPVDLWTPKCSQPYFLNAVCSAC